MLLALDCAFTQPESMPPLVLRFAVISCGLVEKSGQSLLYLGRWCFDLLRRRQ